MIVLVSVTNCSNAPVACGIGVVAGEKIVLIDDLLANGGTSASAATLIKKVGGILLEAQFLIELEFLHGREKLAPTTVVSFLKY